MRLITDTRLNQLLAQAREGGHKTGFNSGLNVGYDVGRRAGFKEGKCYRRFNRIWHDEIEEILEVKQF